MEQDWKKYFDEFLLNMPREMKEQEKLVREIYDPKKMNLVENFILDARIVSLDQVCNPEMERFLFTNDCQDMLLHIDEPSRIRKEQHNERNLFCSYYFEDPPGSCMSKGPVSVDVLVARKPIDAPLKSKLEDLDFFSDAIIDFETLEFPHYFDGSYYRDQFEAVTKLHRDLGKSNKEIAKELRKSSSPLYRDTEKFHLQFAVGKHKNFPDELKFLPVYIGFGTNEPYGIPLESEVGKSRFMRWRFYDEQSLFERGELSEFPLSPNQFEKRFSGISSYGIFWAKDYILCTLEDENPNSGMYVIKKNSSKESRNKRVTIYDEDRFKGFLKVAGPSGNERGFLVVPRFKVTQISQDAYLDALVNGSNPGIPVVRNEQDIYNLLKDNLPFYEEFSCLAYDPSFTVKKFGLDAVIKRSAHKLGNGESKYNNLSNIAHDLNAMGTDSHERLKISALIIGNYIKTGKFRKLLEATYRG